MNRYVAFLRGINVSGQKKILMADLRVQLESAGLQNVASYIQSGNLVLDHDGSAKDVQELIFKSIKKEYGWEVPVLVRNSEEIERVLDECPFPEEIKSKSYFTLFQETPETENIEALNQVNYPNEEFYVFPQCMYYYCSTGYGKAKMTNKFIENKLKVSATTRNYNTMKKMLELAY